MKTPKQLKNHANRAKQSVIRRIRIYQAVQVRNGEGCGPVGFTAIKYFMSLDGWSDLDIVTAVEALVADGSILLIKRPHGPEIYRNTYDLPSPLEALAKINETESGDV
jgi:hypothetical protein